MNKIINTAIDALTDAAQFMDGLRHEAISDGWWSDFDQQTRDKISAALNGLYALKDGLITVMNGESNEENSE